MLPSPLGCWRTWLLWETRRCAMKRSGPKASLATTTVSVCSSAASIRRCLGRSRPWLQRWLKSAPKGVVGHRSSKASRGEGLGAPKQAKRMASTTPCLHYPLQFPLASLLPSHPPCRHTYLPTYSTPSLPPLLILPSPPVQATSRVACRPPPPTTSCSTA